jgi:O-antigen/teichoic acid export membrane protein
VPTLSRLQDDPDRFRAFYRKAVLLIATSTFPAIAGLFMEARAAVLIILGDQWLPTVPLIQILAPVAATAMLSMTTRWVFVALGQTRRLLRWRTFESTVKIVAIAAGVSWGATGVAWALLLANLVLLVPGLWFCFLETRIRLSDIFAAVWKPSVATVTAVVAIGVIRAAGSFGDNVVTDFVLEASVFISVYLATWLVLPGGRVTLLELLGLARELRRRPNEPQ